MIMFWIAAAFFACIAWGFYVLRSERRAAAEAKKLAQQQRARRGDR